MIEFFFLAQWKLQHFMANCVYLCGQFFLTLYISYFKPSPLNKCVTSSEILSPAVVFLVISLLIGFLSVINMLNSLLPQNFKLSIILFPPTNKAAFISLRLLGYFLHSVTAVFFFFFFFLFSFTHILFIPGHFHFTLFRWPKSILRS